MTAKEKSLSVICAILAVPWGVATVGLAGGARWPRPKNIEAVQETDGAYRDGVFWGERDARQGRKVQPSIGRWSNEKDRTLFKTGYQKGYRQALTSRNAAHPHVEQGTR